MTELLSTIRSPEDVRALKHAKQLQLAAEVREVLCRLVTTRSAHFASNLGVVELCIALHSEFDFRRDRLIWDTGHQIYPHKLLTGRFPEFHTIRTKGGLMGYPDPQESPFDLFLTGHAGCSISTVLGLKSGDDLMGEPERHAVAVIGDGAFPSGIVYEALNNLGALGKNVLVILNDNKMSICPRVGAVANYLDRLRTNPAYTGFKEELVRLLNKVPLLGDPTERFLAQLKEGFKAGLHGGMLFEELGLRYIGPIDGHDLRLLRKYLRMVKQAREPVLLHVVTEKGHGFTPAASDPVFYHAPPKFVLDDDQPIEVAPSSTPTYTSCMSGAIRDAMQRNPKITVLTAAMCQGNKLETVREQFPDRFFDTGICEAHAVAFAAGQAKAGLRPIVDIYSTFLQRSFDQVFQEVALQHLPVIFTLDRAGLAGPDGPTHHGCFDVAYLRVFPNMVVMAPGDASEMESMLAFAEEYPGACAIRYPKATAEFLDGPRAAMELGKAEMLREPGSGVILCFGALLADCLRASDVLASEGIHVGVVNARFAKPLDAELFSSMIQQTNFVVTVEEAALAGGFGSAVLELAADRGLDSRRIRRMGIPDQFIEHGERAELLADLGLDASGIARACRAAAGRGREAAPPRRPMAPQ